MPKTRDPVFDIMKGFAILFVIMSHTNLPYSSHVFVSLRSPLFFIVSGFFAKEWFFCDFMKNGVKRLLIPMIVTNLAMIPALFLCDYIFETNVTSKAIQSMLLGTSSWCLVGSSVFEMSAGPLWFVWASILVRIYWSFLQRVKTELLRGIIIFALAIVSFKSKSYFTLPFSFQASFGAMGFFYAGYIIKHYNLLENGWGKRLFTPCLVCLIYNTCFSNIDINFCWYGGGYMIDLLGCVGAFFIVYSVVKMNYDLKNRFWQVVNFIGRYSLVALCVHSIDQCLLVHWLPVKFWTWFALGFEQICAYIIRILFVVFLTYLISKNKFLCEKIFFIK